MRRLPAAMLAAAVALAGACRVPWDTGAPPSPGASAGDTATAATPADGVVAADTARWQIAYVEFAGELRSSDVGWLRSEGFQVVSTHPQSRSAMVRVPPRYARDPMRANPRIVRFEVRMR
ncbi:MAG TPA: hypothetical protein VHG28_10990 [Longimicrobiaceae bacterium]|nr:hypothetical protein [Longimicrobiaceae bacterium]